MSDKPVNFYEKIPADMRKVYHNPGFKKHQLKVPFRVLTIGGSGSGKTNWLMNMIKITSGTFEHIAVCLKSKHEPLYEFLAKKLPNSVTFFENQIPPMSELEQYEQSLIVFDDLVASKNLQGQISDYFIRGRKQGISMVYISQSYYAVPKLIRQQCQYIILKKLSSDKDLALILREYGFNVSFEDMMDLYEKATKTKEGFLMIDLEADNDKKFRINWKVVPVRKAAVKKTKGRKVEEPVIDLLSLSDSD
jgi:hypothetical protein